MRRYFAVLDQVRQDSSQPIATLNAVATSTQLSAVRRLVQRERSKQQHQTGATQVVTATVQSVNLDNSNPKTGKVPTVTIDVCWDVSGVDVVNAAGHSVVTSDRPQQGWVRYLVSNYHWTEHPQDGWRVAGGKALERTSCSDT
jgi:hypothetical protein